MSGIHGRVTNKPENKLLEDINSRNKGPPMSLLTKMKYSFVSRGIDTETFTVVSFKGYEAISRPYAFEITLASDHRDIDPLRVLRNPAVFTIHRDEEENVDFNGILMQFEETREFDGILFFKAVLSPKFWWLSLTHHNQVFLDATVPDILENALKDGGLASGIDFEFRLQKTYASLEYVCQYDESHFDFVSRWAQREGLYYFFEQTPTGEKIIFTDTKISHMDLLQGKDLVYIPQSGLDTAHTREVVKSFVCKHNLLPARIYLKDYHYLKPSQAMEGIAEVDENGRGENYIYGENFDTVEDGNRLARIRAEALLCRKSSFHGESSVPYLVPGFTFDLNEHYKAVYNHKYLVIDVTHEGHQAGYLISGLSGAVEQKDEQMFYANTFSAIYADAQFRAEHTTIRPKISGTLNAKIDASGSGEHAELDEYGRYKVILPFDRSGRFGGKASAWFRMMQPSAGQNQGIHFPLHKGTEVLLTFIDGNPDRPVIAGAIPNPETTSPITSENQKTSIIKTGRTPVLPSTVGASYIDSESGAATKTHNNFMEFDDGTPNHIHIHSPGNIWVEAQNRYGEYHAYQPSAALPTDPEPSTEILLAKFGADGDYNPTGMRNRFDSTQTQTDFFTDVMKNAHVCVSSLDTVKTQEGNIYDFGGYWVYNLGNAYVENHMNQKAVLNATGNITIDGETVKADLLDKGGPGWTKIDWPEGTGIECDLKWAGAGGGQPGVWVEKKFGNSYSYTQGDSASVTVGTTLNITRGRTVDIVYRGDGSLKTCTSSRNPHKERKWSDNGQLIFKRTESADELTVEEETFCYETGRTLTKSKTEFGTLGFSSESKFDFVLHKNVNSFSFGTASVFSCDIAGKTGIEIEIGPKTGLLLGAGFEFYGDFKPSWKVKLTKGQLKLHGPGMLVTKEEEMKANLEKLVLKKLASDINTVDLVCSNTKLKAQWMNSNVLVSNMTLFG